MSTTQNDKARAGIELLRVIEQLGREKGIHPETAFTAIERAVRLAIGKHYGDDEDVVIAIDRQRGTIHAQKGDKIIDPHTGTLGRIAAQAAKQQMIQLFREEESQSLMVDMERMKGQLLVQPGMVQRMEGGAAIVSIGKTEAILPRSEQIPGETHHVGEKIRALVLDVKKVGHRVKVILSRTNPQFVQRLFEREIPEIEDRTIKIERVAREAGYRTKVAVSSIDSRVDCVGACVGVRGSRIKNIVEELGGVERIDIVRWNDSLQVLIQNSLQPATIEEVFLYEMLQRAIVLVKEDQLSLAIGRRGQNVRLASKLVEWDIEIMTADELGTAIEKAESQFSQMPGVTQELVEALIEQGFLSYEDVAVLTPAELCEMGGMDEDTALDMIAYADEESQRTEKDAKPGKPRESTAVPTAAERFDSLFAPQAHTEGGEPTVEAVEGEEQPQDEAPVASSLDEIFEEDVGDLEAVEEAPTSSEEGLEGVEPQDHAGGAEGDESTPRAKAEDESAG
ncbi:MAG: transcription termination factor NusA [Gemmataceae bacterium]